MTPHARIYLDYFGLIESDVILCEVCGKVGADIHHIYGRGKGKDTISNLMCVCRLCHQKAHGGTKTYLHPDVMQAIHDTYVNNFLTKGVTH